MRLTAEYIKEMLGEYVEVYVTSGIGLKGTIEEVFADGDFVIVSERGEQLVNFMNILTMQKKNKEGNY